MNLKTTTFNVKGLIQTQRDFGIWWIVIAIILVGIYESTYIWMNDLYPYPVCANKVMKPGGIFCGEKQQNYTNCTPSDDYYSGQNFLCPFYMYSDFGNCYGKVKLYTAAGIPTDYTYLNPFATSNPFVKVSETSGYPEYFCGENSNRETKLCFKAPTSLSSKYLFYCPFWYYVATPGNPSGRNCSSFLQFIDTAAGTGNPYCIESSKIFSSCSTYNDKFKCPYDDNYFGNNFCTEFPENNSYCVERFQRTPYCKAYYPYYICFRNSTYPGGGEYDLSKVSTTYLANGIVSAGFFVILGTLSIFIEVVSIRLLIPTIVFMFISWAYIAYMLAFFFYIRHWANGGLNGILLAAQTLQIIFAFILNKKKRVGSGVDVEDNGIEENFNENNEDEDEIEDNTPKKSGRIISKKKPRKESKSKGKMKR